MSGPNSIIFNDGVGKKWTEDILYYWWNYLK